MSLARSLLALLKEKNKYVTIPTIKSKLNFSGNVATMFTLQFFELFKKQVKSVCQSMVVQFCTFTFETDWPQKLCQGCIQCKGDLQKQVIRSGFCSNVRMIRFKRFKKRYCPLVTQLQI